jgi:hypothetical protein
MEFDIAFYIKIIGEFNLVRISRLPTFYLKKKGKIKIHETIILIVI